MTTRQQKALQALILCPTKAAAAKQAGIGISTLKVYLKDSEFVTAYNEAVRDMLTAATRKAQDSMSPAINVLCEIVEDTEAPHSARISAARSILEYGLRMTEITDIMTDLEGANVL